MITKPLVAGLLAAGCVTAAAGGAYVAVRQNAAEGTNVQSVPAAVPAPAPATVAETEGVVAPQSEMPPPEEPAPLVAPSSGSTPPVAASSEPELERPAATSAPRSRPTARPTTAEIRSRTRSSGRPVASADRKPERASVTTNGPNARASTSPVVPASLPPLDAAELPAVAEAIPALPEPEFIQVVLPASSVIGLQIETAVSTERARVEDRVDARVTRDVMADGRVAIPAGSRVIGSVTLVEQGGKIKERARLGVRFHTIVFADGSEMPIRTEAIYREGESPSGESAKKIGGATVGGAILGAIIGGGKGAMIGGAAGAAGGTAATMAGGRNAATLPAGAVVTVRLSEPLTLDLEKHER